MLKMTQELSELKLEKSKFGDYKKDLNKYVSFGLTIITNLDYFYDKAPIEVKLNYWVRTLMIKLYLKK